MHHTTNPQDAVVERVARHLAARDWSTTDDRWDGATASFRADYLAAAREVLALVPSAVVSADRATLLREAAARLEERNPDRSADFSEGVDWALDELRAMADDASRVAAEEQPAETQCSCGGAFPVRHLHADEHRPAVGEQPDRAVPLRAELKPWQLLTDAPGEPLPQTERLVGGRRLKREAAPPAVTEQPDTQTREAFVPPAHYRGRDGTAYCVHATPVGPDSCRHCRELAE